MLDLRDSQAHEPGSPGRVISEVSRDLADVYVRLPPMALANHNFYMDTGRLRIQTSNMRNSNTKEHLEQIKLKCLQNLSQ